MVTFDHWALPGVTRPEMAYLADSSVDRPAEKCLYVCLVFADVTFQKRYVSAFRQLLEEQLPDVLYVDSVGVLRPDFSPELLRGADYLGDALFVRSDVLDELGLPDVNLGVAAKLEFALRALRAGKTFAHLRQPLTVESALGPELSTELSNRLQAIVQSHLTLTGGGEVREVLSPTLFPSSRGIQGEPLVSIVIPSQATWKVVDGERTSLLLNAVRSISAKTDYPHYEVVVVVDRGADEEILSALSKILGDRLVVVWWEKPFNFSLKMNFGVVHSRGEYILLLNDDVDVIRSDWLTSMLGLAQLPNAGMVGAMLYYQDDTIQHAGHAYYKGSPTHLGLGAPRESSGPQHLFEVEREVSGVTAACALMPREVYFAVGGFTALLPGNFNDVDLCMKVGWRGYDIYWTPFAELYHFESKTRDAHVHYYELDVIEHRWGNRLDDARFWRGHPAALS